MDSEPPRTEGASAVRPFWRQLGVFWIVSALWGMGCRDVCAILDFEGEGPAFGPWGLLPTAIALLVIGRFLYKHGKKTPERRDALLIIGAALALLGGWKARNRAAAELWDLKCARRVNPIYCYHAASTLEAFTFGDKDLLGRRCMPGEPPLLCYYSPPDDRTSCDQMANACAGARRARLRRHAFVDPICDVFTERCARAAEGRPSRPRPSGPFPWPPGWPHPVVQNENLPAWLTARRPPPVDGGGHDGGHAPSR